MFLLLLLMILFQILVLYFWDQILQRKRQIKFCEEKSPGSFAAQKFRISWWEDHWIKRCNINVIHKSKGKKEKIPECILSSFFLLLFRYLTLRHFFWVLEKQQWLQSAFQVSPWRWKEGRMFWHCYTFVYNLHFIPILFMFLLQIW